MESDFLAHAKRRGYGRAERVSRRQSMSSASQMNIDLFEHHYVSARYAIEKQNGGTRTFDELAEEYKNRPDKAANILASTELQCDWLREIGYEEVDYYMRIFELAVFGGRKPN